MDKKTIDEKVREAAKICGVSRATLLRLEKMGFDKPARINPDNGFRYYDCLNIMKVQQYLSLRELGVGWDEIMAYYRSELDNDMFLKKLKDRLSIAQRCVDEFEARFTERESISFSYVSLPDVTCYCFPCAISKIKEQVEHNYIEIKKMYDAGFMPYPSTPMFSILPDFDTIYDGTTPDPYRSTICMTIYPEPNPDPSRVRTVKGRKAFSLLYHGNSDEIMESGGHLLWEEMRRRNIRPAGPLYGINVVGIFFGNEIEPDDYVFRWAVPVED